MRISMFRKTCLLLCFLLLPVSLCARVVVFWQPGFPTIASQPVDRATLEKAFEGLDPVFLDEAALAQSDALANTDLLVLPYGSALPVEAWKNIEPYAHSGGNLLIVGGQPFRVPVRKHGDAFTPEAPQDTYARTLGLRHTYEIPVSAEAKFQWRDGYTWLPKIQLQAEKFFTVQGELRGLGYMADADGQLVAAPVIVTHHGGNRIVALDFLPRAGYWSSADGIALLRASAQHARRGTERISLDVEYAALRPGELPLAWIELDAARLSASARREVKVELSANGKTISASTLSVAQAAHAHLDVPFHSALPAGFYTLTATFLADGAPREFTRNGFFVGERKDLESGPTLGTKNDFLNLDGKTFFPTGTNYFTTEDTGWDFSEPRNAWVWERDFASMEAHGVNFVRTGVWMQNSRFLEHENGGVSERFLRNVEAYLRCAQRHHIVVNFTFFAFSPRAHQDAWGAPDPNLPQDNPYTQNWSRQLQQSYIRSIVERFHNLPWLCWDLINEPSFSNPHHIFSGNYPNGDASETGAWRDWLRHHYATIDALAAAWRVPAGALGGFDSLPLPGLNDLRFQTSENPNQARALDYNLFAQDAFIDWMRAMIETIRSTGSAQLVNVGQDEGGVTDRVLNQFYGGAGVAFTTNHTYWNEDALLWDSVAARRKGTPNIVGETGYQPAWSSDGEWRWDEISGLGRVDRRWALGFAAGSSGLLQWDWSSDEADFGMLRNDGSAKVWMRHMSELSTFARVAATHADALVEPDVALVLPQSLQLSVGNALALEAQQNAVRALYHYARGEAYAVGEYQTALLGSPKLILLPSPIGLTNEAWAALEEHVRAGAVLLITGPFRNDAHMHSTQRAEAIGLPTEETPLTTLENSFVFPGGSAWLRFDSRKTNTLSRVVLPDGSDWMEKPLGKGRILLAALPLELSGNLDAIGAVYRYAMQVAKISPVYTTSVRDPGLLICPTVYPRATLYVFTSESAGSEVAFTDTRSGKSFAGHVEPGSAAMLLIGADGTQLAAYRWQTRKEGAAR